MYTACMYMTLGARYAYMICMVVVPNDLRHPFQICYVQIAVVCVPLVLVHTCIVSYVRLSVRPIATITQLYGHTWPYGAI